MPWGIGETASEIEKIRAESSDMLGGLNSCGDLGWDTYSILWDFYNSLLGKAYEQGLKDAPRENWRPAADRDWESSGTQLLCKDIHDECMVGWIFEDLDSDTGFSAQNEGVYMYDVVEWMRIPG